MGIPENIKRLRAEAHLSQPALAKKARVSQQLISQLENGKNLTTKFLPQIARALGAGVSAIDPNYMQEALEATIVPLLSWISAGQMLRDDVADEALGSISVSDLPPGDWIALKVVGDSMDRISPPESIIFVDRRDKRLVPNRPYVIADEDGNATYKRFRPGPPMRFEPVSTNPAHEPMFPEQEPTIVGRVKRTQLEM